jgi:hypothetical protein
MYIRAMYQYKVEKYDLVFVILPAYCQQYLWSSPEKKHIIQVCIVKSLDTLCIGTYWAEHRKGKKTVNS